MSFTYLHFFLFLIIGSKNMINCVSRLFILCSLTSCIAMCQANKEKVQPVSGALAGLLSKDPDLKYMAQRAFTTYLRSVHVRSDKSIFDVIQLPHAEYAASLGLPTTPRIRFLKRGVKGGKNIQGSDEVTNLSNVREINGSFFCFIWHYCFLHSFYIYFPSTSIFGAAMFKRVSF